MRDIGGLTVPGRILLDIDTVPGGRNVCLVGGSVPERTEMAAPGSWAMATITAAASGLR